jgi:hypothetical protein
VDGAGKYLFNLNDNLMSKAISFLDTFPIYKVEYDCIVSKSGDITLASEATLPEIFTLSDHDYEALHHVLVKAVKVLPIHSIFHKQDWFRSKQYTGNFTDVDLSFLGRASERFFNERPFLDHQCYMMLTLQSADRKTKCGAAEFISTKRSPRRGL